MQRPVLRATLGLLALALVLPFWPFGTAAVSAASRSTSPIGICLQQPTLVHENGQDVLRCPHPLKIVPRNKGFYMFVAIKDSRGFQTYALDWRIQRWQPKKRKWTTVRSETNVSIHPSWQYVWFREYGLAKGRYRALISSNYLAKYVGAPVYHFASTFTVR